MAIVDLLDKVKGGPLVGRVAAARAEVIRARWKGELGGGALAAAPRPADGLSAEDLPSTALLGRGDRTLAEIDQDGYAFATHPADEPLFNRRKERLTRLRYGLAIVLRDGAAVVEKKFNRGKWWGLSIGHYLAGQLEIPFFTEVAALRRLQGLSFVPGLRGVDVAERVVRMDYVHGTTMQRMLAEGGVALLDAQGAGFGQIDDATRLRREIDSFVPHRERLRRPLREMLDAMIDHGVAPLDVKLGNLVIGQKTGRPYWIDFEIAHLASMPGHARNVAEARRLFAELFDA